MPRVKSKTETKKRSRKPVGNVGLNTDIFNPEGKVVGKMALPKEIFAAKVNQPLLAQAVRVYLANQRQGTASTKTRGEVAGSTRKIYRQKGTGRARHGSLKAPIFVGGGIIFGPKPRDFSLKLPKKMKTQALFAALTSQFKQKNILILANLSQLKTKTAAVVKILKNLKLIADDKLNWPTLLVTTQEQENLRIASRNIKNLTLIPFNLLHPYFILANQKIIFSQEAMEGLCQS